MAASTRPSIRSSVRPPSGAQDRQKAAKIFAPSTDWIVSWAALSLSARLRACCAATLGQQEQLLQLPIGVLLICGLTKDMRLTERTGQSTPASDKRQEARLGENATWTISWLFLFFYLYLAFTPPRADAPFHTGRR